MTTQSEEAIQPYTQAACDVVGVMIDERREEVLYSGPFEGFPDEPDPEEAIMAQVTLSCLTAACATRQKKKAHEQAYWVQDGRTTPKRAAGKILTDMGCGVTCPKIALSEES